MTICPIAPPALKPVQNLAGQRNFSIERFACSINCPHFIKDEKNITLKCQSDSSFILESEESAPVTGATKLFN